MEKLYYSISEVSELLGINASHLRFWEKEFQQLKPKRNAKDTRFYSKEDITLLKQIIYLVNDQHLTLEGARKKLSEKKDQVAKQYELAERLKRVQSTLKGLSNALSLEQE